MNLFAAKDFIQSHNDFLLAAHRSPDGDTLGSCLALRLALLALGKTVTVACVDPVPPYLAFLPGAKTVTAHPDHVPEAAIYIDCADHSRIAELEVVTEAAPYRFCIDHHGTNPKRTKDGDWVEEVGATAEMIERLIVELLVPLTKDMATCLFTGIATDTGNFAYSNTTPDTFRIAAELVEAGIELPELNRRLFRTMPVRKGRLIAHTLQTMELYENESVAVACVTKADLDRCGADEADCEGLIDYLRDLAPVEIACTLRESADGFIRGSLRAKQGADVSVVAQQFRGGGHVRAAGCTLDGPMESAKAQIVPALIEAVKQWKASLPS